MVRFDLGSLLQGQTRIVKIILFFQNEPNFSPREVNLAAVVFL